MARHLIERSRVQREADTMIHKPCGLLSDAEIPRHFARANTVFAIDYQPHCAQPFIETDGRILKDSSDLQGELSLSVLAIAFIAVHALKVGDVIRTAVRAARLAIRPAQTCQRLVAVFGIGEVDNRLLVDALPAPDQARHRSRFDGTYRRACDITDMMELDPLPIQHGRSLCPYLEGRRIEPRDHIFSEYLETEEAYIRTDRWKFIYWTKSRPDGNRGKAVLSQLVRGRLLLSVPSRVADFVEP
jgi:hypothetical protein